MDCPRQGTGRMLTHEGITDTIQGWARRLGMSDVTIRRRLASGATDEQALTEPVVAPRGGRPKLFEFNGESKTLKEWGKQYNISPAQLYRRIHDKGWDIKTALETPTDGRCYSSGDVSNDEVTIDDVVDILNK